MLIPIQYLELLTICLVFLFIFRVFKALSLENNTSLIGIPQPEILPLSPILEKNHHKLITLEPIIASEPALRIPFNLEKTPQADAIQIQPSTNQTLLNNYIGDFF